ncbi:DUF3347 domain-containing protein [Niabella drilacis]|uniref:DUF3347 domain-containing protein n=1 Tax=Niabella drilacis (strain DSM 25811 / CCM 8410 / CCUG 62505 / LMG 26954 / E90) TaxID=1285928 RepID=A0A1G6L9X5_NIADE|nr:DUF3347 domain-containing protein [Niabella drilacis]SDC39356.1 Protein of unknown function [Niabella drilacis]
MKQLLLWGWMAIAAVACNTPGTGEQPSAADTASSPQVSAQEPDTTKQLFSATAILDAYFALGTALFEEQATGITNAANTLGNKLQAGPVTELPAVQQKEVKEIIEASVENAAHIAASKDQPGHQREHFQMLSEDLYDLVKIAGTKTVVYKFTCASLNNGKGGSWLSNQQTLKNPYTGAARNNCGTITETVNP